MKTVGIIGGLGPETTAEFYLDIIFSCQKKSKTNRPAIIIASVPLSYKIEENAIMKNKGIEKYVPLLVNEAKRLEKAGADFIVMPCNSLHVFIKEIRSAVSIPALSIIEETAKFLQKRKITKAGIVSTAITARHKLYERELQKHHISYSTPNKNDQLKLNQIIYKLVIGKKDKSNSMQLLQIINNFKDIDCVVLACTDLQLLKPVHPTSKIFDTMKILADATVEKLLK